MLRVTGFDMPYPPAKLEEHFLPDLDRVLTPSTARSPGKGDSAQCPTYKSFPWPTPRRG